MATLTTSALGTGTHSITAQFSGDFNHEGSTSVPVAQAVNNGIGSFATTATISSAANSSIGGFPVALAIKVSGPGGIPSGSVSIYQSAFGGPFQQIGTATLSGGQATYTIPVLDAQYGTTNYGFMAINNGDATYTTSESAAFQQSVVRATTAVALTASPSSTVIGQAATFSANQANGLRDFVRQIWALFFPHCARAVLLGSLKNIV